MQGLRVQGLRVQELSEGEIVQKNYRSAAQAVPGQCKGSAEAAQTRC